MRDNENMCELEDCPLCELSQEVWDVIAPVSDDDDVEAFQRSQLGPADDKSTSTSTSGPFSPSEPVKTQS
jgi:hypothetical protein